MLDAEVQKLVDLYRSYLMDWNKQSRSLDRAWAQARKIMMPDEVAETGKLLDELNQRSLASQKDLMRMIAEHEPAVDLLRRNLSALERSIEAMRDLTIKLGLRARQPHVSKKRQRTGRSGTQRTKRK
jgi:hypothetical protein